MGKTPDYILRAHKKYAQTHLDAYKLTVPKDLHLFERFKALECGSLRSVLIRLLTDFVEAEEAKRQQDKEE